MYRFLQVFYAIFSGALLALAIPNELYKLGSPLLGLFSLVPLYIAVSRSKTYNEAFLVCALQALTCHVASSFWLGFFHGFALGFGDRPLRLCRGEGLGEIEGIPHPRHAVAQQQATTDCSAYFTFGCMQSCAAKKRLKSALAESALPLRSASCGLLLSTPSGNGANQTAF